MLSTNLSTVRFQTVKFIEDLKTCLEIKEQGVEQGTNRREINKTFTAAGIAFIVFAQAAVFALPSKGTLDNPTTRLDSKTNLSGGSSNNFKSNPPLFIQPNI
jgi:hypothetical protein